MTQTQVLKEIGDRIMEIESTDIDSIRAIEEELNAVKLSSTS